LNGIDVKVWNPSTDSYLTNHFDIKTITKGKAASKKEICELFQLDMKNRCLFHWQAGR
jgi:starch synthase